MKRLIFLFLTILMITSGVGFLLYPTVSNWVTSHFRELEIEYYNESVDQMDPELAATELEKAKAYNDALTGSNIEDPFIPGSGIALPDNYTSVLNIDGTIGYIKIPKINVYLPIYHGTSEEVLQKGVGHLENTAFPISGKGNHAVLTGHTGLNSARLFTDLTELETGDVFYITTLDRKLAYEVDRILVIEPDDTEDLRPVKGEDYVTLVTCTPYGVNSHRLLVRGTNIPCDAEKVEEAPEEGVVHWMDWQTVLVVSSLLFIAAAVTIYMFVRRRRRRKNKTKQEEGQ